LTIEYLQKQGIRSVPQQGVNAITVPGAVDGWQKLADKFGRKKLAEDLAAAIRTSDHASSGLRNTSPTFGARSPGR